MAKPITYTAETQGFTFTRKSHRTYTHAVLVQESKRADREACERSARQSWHMNLAYHQACAEGRNPTAARFLDQYPPARLEADRVAAQEWLDMGEAGHVAAALARHDARAAEVKTLDDGDTYFTCAGWCGRLDLAGKLAGSHVGSVIVEAVATP